MNRIAASARILVIAMAPLCLALGISVAGCKGTDTDPTNTKNSTYMDKGDTAADRIGARRIRAHPQSGTATPP